jgi:dTDP-4-amino-4,6-dideoxygalactose transaminase
MGRVLLSPPDVGPRERELLLAAFDSGWIAPVGPELSAFEAEVAAVVGVGHAVALSSGTAALHLALELVGVGPGDEVLVPTLTFVASATAVRHAGASPVFVDAEATSWCVDPALVADELARRAAAGRLPAAVMTVDLYGQCADYDALVAACDRWEVPLVEDAAEALGATHRAGPAGSFGRAAALSFNGNKIITTSGGGMLVSDDGELVERARFLATQARDPAPHYEHSVAGYNYRLSNLLAAVGRGQLEGLAAKVARRTAINRRYRDALADLPGVGFMPDAPWGTPTHWLTVVTLDPAVTGRSPEQVRLALEADDVEARPAWKPMHLQPLFADAPAVGGAVAAGIFATGLCLPSGSAMTDGDQERVVASFRRALGATGP